MGNRELKIICYADDPITMAEAENDLQRLLHEFCITAKQYNMSISTEKTKTVVIAKEPIKCKLVVDDKPIEQVLEVDYLGIKISSIRKIEKEVKHQVNKAIRIAGCLNDTILTKTRIFKSVI